MAQILLVKQKKELNFEENKSKNIIFFFKLLWRRLGPLLSLNILLLPSVIPLISCIFIFIFGPTQPTESNILFSSLYGISQFNESSSALFLDWYSHSGVLNWSAYHSSSFIWMIILSVVTLLIWGFIHTGGAFVLRGFVRGDAVFVGSDFFYAIKRNFWKAFGIGFFDLTIIVLLIFDFFYCYSNLGSSFLGNVVYVAVFLILVLYFIMRMYIYPMFVTFDLSLKKLLKNALIFAALGIKRNIMAILGLIVLIGINVLLFKWLLPLGLALPLILPFVHFLAFSQFIMIYCSYPIIERYMIDPYKKEDSSDE